MCVQDLVKAHKELEEVLANVHAFVKFVRAHRDVSVELKRQLKLQPDLPQAVPDLPSETRFAGCVLLLKAFLPMFQQFRATFYDEALGARFGSDPDFQVRSLRAKLKS